MMSKKLDPYYQWRENHKQFYHFVYENFLDWPVTSIQWGPLIHQGPQSTTQRIFFSCKTDGIYNAAEHTWTNNPNYIVIANVEIPRQDHYFISDLKSIFNYDAAKKHPNIKVKQIISHPGEITVIRASPVNRKLMASKSDTNQVYVWLSQKYKSPQQNFTNTPEIVLQTTTSVNHNYAMRFTPSLPRIITASENKLELFDLQSQPAKRQLGSVFGNNIIRPLVSLEGKVGTQDIAFKNNEICMSGGQDKQISIWDLRIGQLVQKVQNLHQNDINTLACKDNYILSGGQQGRVNIIDERTYKVVEKFQEKYPIHSLKFNPNSNHFAVGKDYLSIYSLDNILETHKFDPIFTHYGLRGNIHQFDWNQDAPMTIAQTYQDPQPQSHSSQGGIVHIYRPLDLMFMKKQESLQSIQKAFNKMSEQEKKKLLASL